MTNISLDVSVVEILGVGQVIPKKRGPKSQIEQQLEIITELPRPQQPRILSVLEALIAKNNINTKRTSNSTSAKTR